jgi:hypothetical protein
MRRSSSTFENNGPYNTMVFDCLWSITREREKSKNMLYKMGVEDYRCTPFVISWPGVRLSPPAPIKLKEYQSL